MYVCIHKFIKTKDCKKYVQELNRTLNFTFTELQLHFFLTNITVHNITRKRTQKNLDRHLFYLLITFIFSKCMRSLEI